MDVGAQHSPPLFEHDELEDDDDDEHSVPMGQPSPVREGTEDDDDDEHSVPMGQPSPMREGPEDDDEHSVPMWSLA